MGGVTRCGLPNGIKGRLRLEMRERENSGDGERGDDEEKEDAASWLRDGEVGRSLGYRD